MAEISGLNAKAIQEGLLDVGDDWKIAYRYRQGPGPTWVFLNGLGEDLSTWDPITDFSRERATLQLNLRGQGQCAFERLRTKPATHFRFPIATQSDDLYRVLEALQIPSPVVLVGYSYGGGVALDFASRWPENVRRLALIVPFVIRLDHAFPLQRLWSWQWKMAKSFGLVPSGVSGTLENSYDTFLSIYMNHRYEKRLSDTVARKIAIELSHGIMPFNAFEVLDSLPDKSVFLLSAELDTLVPRSLYREFWRRLPEEKKGHWTPIPDGDHLLLEQMPDLVKEWLKRLDPLDN